METNATTTAQGDATGQSAVSEADLLKSIQGLSIDQMLAGESVNPEAGKHTPAPDTASPDAPKSGATTETKSGNQTQQEQSAPKDQKSDERAAKTWEEINREKADIQRQREELARASADLARKREELLPEARKAMQSADDYDTMAKEWAAEGRDDLAQRAKERATNLRREAQEAQAQGQAAAVQNAQMAVMREVVTEHPELRDRNSDLFKGVEEIMRVKPVLATYPEGIRDAVEVVRSRLEARSAASLRTEVENLKKQLAERDKLLQPGTGAPSAGASEGKSFDDLPLADREKRLREAVRTAELRGETVI